MPDGTSKIVTTPLLAACTRPWQPSGAVRRLPLDGSERMLGSTDALPLSFLLSTVRDRVGEIVLIGIQPTDRSPGEMFAPVEAGARELLDLLSTDCPQAIPARSIYG